MNTPVATLIDPAFAPVFGFAGLAAQMAWPLFRGREAILTVQLSASCSYAASYALLGQDTATAVCLTGAIQTTVALLAGDRPWLSRLGYVFVPFVLAVGALTYSGLPTILAVTACCLIMIGRMQANTIRLRGIQITASPFGAAHDAVVGAWPNFAGALVSFAIAALALRRELHARHQATYGA